MIGWRRRPGDLELKDFGSMIEFRIHHIHEQVPKDEIPGVIEFLAGSLTPERSAECCPKCGSQRRDACLHADPRDQKAGVCCCVHPWHKNAFAGH